MLLCDWVRRIWFGSPLCLTLDPLHISSFDNWCSHFLSDKSPFDAYEKAYITCLCWNIWKIISASVLNATALNPICVLCTTKVAVEEYWTTNNLIGWREPVTADSSFMTELLACQKAVQLALDYSNQKVIVETDCLDLFKALSKKDFSCCAWSTHNALSDLYE